MNDGERPYPTPNRLIEVPLATVPGRDARLAPFTRLKRPARRPDNVSAGLGRIPDLDFKRIHLMNSVDMVEQHSSTIFENRQALDVPDEIANFSANL